MRHSVYLVVMAVFAFFILTFTMAGIDWLLMGRGVHPLLSILADLLSVYGMVITHRVHCGEYEHG